MLIHVSTVPVQERRCPGAVTVHPIPTTNRVVIGKSLVPMTDVRHISRSITQAWGSQPPDILLLLVMIMDVQAQEPQEAFTAANIPVRRVPVQERH